MRVDASAHPSEWVWLMFHIRLCGLWRHILVKGSRTNWFPLGTNVMIYMSRLCRMPPGQQTFNWMWCRRYHHHHHHLLKCRQDDDAKRRRLGVNTLDNRMKIYTLRIDEKQIKHLRYYDVDAWCDDVLNKVFFSFFGMIRNVWTLSYGFANINHVWAIVRECVYVCMFENKQYSMVTCGRYWESDEAWGDLGADRRDRRLDG